MVLQNDNWISDIVLQNDNWISGIIKFRGLSFTI